MDLESLVGTHQNSHSALCESVARQDGQEPKAGISVDLDRAAAWTRRLGRRFAAHANATVAELRRQEREEEEEQAATAAEGHQSREVLLDTELCVARSTDEDATIAEGGAGGVGATSAAADAKAGCSCNEPGARVRVNQLLAEGNDGLEFRRLSLARQLLRTGKACRWPA